MRETGPPLGARGPRSCRDSPAGAGLGHPAPVMTALPGLDSEIPLLSQVLPGLPHSYRDSATRTGPGDSTPIVIALPGPGHGWQLGTSLLSRQPRRAPTHLWRRSLSRQPRRATRTAGPWGPSFCRDSPGGPRAPPAPGAPPSIATAPPPPAELPPPPPRARAPLPSP